jgi:hypothetical protein
MKMIIDVKEQTEDKAIQPYCTTTFEAQGAEVKNSYPCNQPRFTVSDSWNLLKQKREFPGKG